MSERAGFFFGEGIPRALATGSWNYTGLTGRELLEGIAWQDSAPQLLRRRLQRPASKGMIATAEVAAMLDYLSLFLVLTLIAGVFGFVGKSGSVEETAQILCASFAVLSTTFIILIRYRQTVRV